MTTAARCSNRFALIAALLLALISRHAFAVSKAFTVPIDENTHWVFLHSGTETDFQGVLTSFGPFVQDIIFQATNRTLFGQQADLALTVDQPSFYVSNADGLFDIVGGDPDASHDFTHFLDPHPFTSTQLIPEGGSIHFMGQLEGENEIPDEFGGGFETFAGSFDLTISYLGREKVTTPLGVFGTDKFKTVEVISYVDSGGDKTTETGTTFNWIVQNQGIIKRTESYVDEYDFGNDGSIDGMDSATDLFEIVSLTGDTVPTDPPSFMKPQYTSNGGATQAAVNDALDAVAASATSTPFTGPPAMGTAFGVVSSLVQLADDDVQAAVHALEADGASPEQAFVRLEIHYDEASLAAIGLSESQLAPYWWDDVHDKWVVVGTTIDGQVGAGMLAVNPEDEQHIGYYGIDFDNDFIWFNVNHASLYGLLTPAPEPTTLIPFAAGLLLLKHRRSRR
ncbi:MAG: PEP-CTERM sorting domain-containing protein [Planctomycetes bacterium]|nr:PEP-CTERM sorting domain-containing protein [Planctomycetota bacterium]